MKEVMRKGTAKDWVDAAYEILIDSGVDSVSVSTLANKLELSRGSFYWFFADRDALLADLLGIWRNQNTGSIVKQAQTYADSLVEAMLNITDCWFRRDLFDSRLEFAIRSWAIQSHTLQKELQQADSDRIDAIKKMLTRFGVREEAADVRARTFYLIQIGYISMQSKEDMAVRMKRIPEYMAMFTGVQPDEKDMQRFYSRIGFDARTLSQPAAALATST